MRRLSSWSAHSVRPGQALCVLLDDLLVGGRGIAAAFCRCCSVRAVRAGCCSSAPIVTVNEVDAAHPLRLTVDARCVVRGAALTEIALLPLGLPELSLLLCDMLTQKPQEIEPLARLSLR